MKNENKIYKMTLVTIAVIVFLEGYIYRAEVLNLFYPEHTVKVSVPNTGDKNTMIKNDTEMNSGNAASKGSSDSVKSGIIDSGNTNNVSGNDTANTNPGNVDVNTDANPQNVPAIVPKPSDSAVPLNKLIENVPFTSQAPLGDWKDPKEQHGCEEASLIMSAYWIKGQDLSLQIALNEIVALSDFESKIHGNSYDTSIADTMKLFQDYYGYKNVSVKYNISVQDIKNEIAKGNLVITPMNGIKLNNPHYTAPGPLLHQLVVIGYDDTKQEFVTNDPGTRYGKSYKYKYDVFISAVRDYKTGVDLPVTTDVKAMMVVEKKQG